jgi:hypothetical protein
MQSLGHPMQQFLRPFNLTLLPLAFCVFRLADMGSFAYGQSSTRPIYTSAEDSALQKIACKNSTGQKLQNGCTIISIIDLTKEFPVRGQYVFVVTQGPSGNMIGGAGEINFCFIQDNHADCGYNISVEFPRIGRVAPVPNYPLNVLLTAKLIYPNKGALFPIIFVQAKDDIDSSTSGMIYTVIWSYQPEYRKFGQIWFNASNLRLKEETRLFTDGPLAGDLVVAATRLDSEPYEVFAYRLNPLVGYSQIIGLSASAEQNTPGPKGPGIDVNMAELLRLSELSEEPQGIGVSSSRTGDYEGGWALIYGILKYYGFDDAADLSTKGIIEKVHSCPFSAADKADFDTWLVGAKFKMQAVLQYGSHGLTAPSKRPDLPDDEASRKDVTAMAKLIEKDYHTMFAGPCLTGSGPDL